MHGNSGKKQFPFSVPLHSRKEAMVAHSMSVDVATAVCTGQQGNGRWITSSRRTRVLHSAKLPCNDSCTSEVNQPNTDADQSSYTVAINRQRSRKSKKSKFFTSHCLLKQERTWHSRKYLWKCLKILWKSKHDSLWRTKRRIMWLLIGLLFICIRCRFENCSD